MPDIKVINRVSGKLETLPLEEADARVAAGSGYDYPSSEEIERAERLEKFGSGGQQALAAGETVARTASFGALQGVGSAEDIAARQRTLREESPGVAFGAQAIGATIPALAGGALAEGAVAAAGLGARAVTAASIGAEGALGGLADEVEQAKADDRPVDAGRAMLVGIGGEVVGRAIPAAIKAGVGRLRAKPTAAGAVAGETIEDLSESAATKAEAKLADEAPDMPAGPERDEALAATAPQQRARADEESVAAAEKAGDLLDKLDDEAGAALEREVEGTTPGHIQWAADTAGRLKDLAADAAPDEAAVLRESADAILEARNGKAIWRAASDARKAINETAAKSPQTLDELSRQFNQITGLSEKGQAALERSRARAGAGGFAHLRGGPAKTTDDVSERAWIYSGKRAQQGLDDDTRAALKEYVESGHDPINRLLRGDTSRSMGQTDYWRTQADKIDRYLASQAEAGNATPGVVYRGVKEGVLPEKLRPGDAWSDPGILSATRDLRQAQNFGGGAIIEIEQSSGVPIFRKRWRNINAEQEVLLRGGTKFEVVSDKLRRLPNRQMRRVVRVREVAAEQAGAFKVPLTDVQVLDKEGYLEPASPRKLKKHAAEIQAAADTAIAGKSLDDLRALPIEGEGAAQSRAKIEAFKQDQSFRETGMLPSNNDRGRGGLPSFTIEPDGSVYLSNGRHRLTAAQESGQEFMVANLKKYNKKGDTVWDYVGPVRVNQPSAARNLGRAGERGFVDVGGAGGRAWEAARAIAGGPLGNVIGAGAGGYVGGQVSGTKEGVAVGAGAGLLVSLLLGGRGSRGAARRLGMLGRAGERGMVNLGGDVANDVAPAAIRRSAKGARLLDAIPERGTAPDFSEWDPADFGKGRGGSNAAGKGAADYSGGQTLSQYQRGIVDGLKKNAGFRENGRVQGDAGKLGSEPTFHVQKDGSIKITHGRLRMTAARELGRDTIYGKVVQGPAKNPEVIFEGQIRVGRGPRSAVPETPDTPIPGAGGAPPAAAAPHPLQAADEMLSAGQADVGVWGRAGEAAADLNRASAPGPGRASAAEALEDQVAAAERWQVGDPKTRGEAAEAARKLRSADELRSDTDRAVTFVDAQGRDRTSDGRFYGAGRSKGGKDGTTKDPSFAQEMASEGAETAFDMGLAAVGLPPVAGMAIKAGRRIWRKLDEQGRAQVMRTARTLLSPLTSQGRWGTARAVTAMTALERFKGDSPDARSAFESRRELLTQAVASPQLVGGAIAESLQGLARESPANFVALSRRLTESVQYVARNLPATVGISLAHPNGIPLSDQELRDVADLWNTAFDPATALDSIARREASPIQMQTLKDLHPDVYQDVQQTIISMAPSTFQQLDSQTKLSIDIMFGSDGAGGLFTTSEAARYVAGANKRAMTEKPKAPGGLPSGVTADTVEPSGVRAVRTGVTNRGVS